MDGWIGEFITWLGAFFVFGTIWFWLVSATVFGWLIYLTEREGHFASALILAGFIWIAASVNGFSIIANPLTAVKWAALYLAIGTIWSFLKWFSFLFGMRDELKKHKQVFVEDKGRPLDAKGKLSAQDLDDFIMFLNSSGYYPNKNRDRIKTPQGIIPTVSGRYSDLTRWIVWWPFSAFWTILNDPLRRIVEGIVRLFRGAYTKLANSVFSSEI